MSPMQDKVKTAVGSSRSQEELSYVIELLGTGAPQMLARASSAQLAREIFKAAKTEHPEGQIVLKKGGHIVADSSR
jgi:hypothetical protein